MSARRGSIVREIPQLRRYARALTGDRARADDLVQDCLERALGRAHLWRASGTVRAWLFAIMHNLHANQVRREQTARRLLTERPPTPIGRADESASGGAVMRDLERALAQLSDEHREVVLLVGLEQLSYREAAGVLGIAEGTVMSRLSRGRARLRALLAGESKPAVRRVK